MTDTFTFQELREFIESRKDETKIDCNIPGALLSHYCAFKTGKLAEFAGYFMAKASSGDPWHPHVLITTDLLVPQFISKIRHCTNFKEVKQLLDTPMELSTDQLYILEIANKTYANGEVNFERAMQLVNSMLKPEQNKEVVFVRDARTGHRIQIYDPTKHHYDIFTSNYWLNDGNFVNIHRKDGTAFRGHCNNATSEVCFYCDHTGEYYYAPDFTRIVCDGNVLCLEKNLDRVHLWASDGAYHYNPTDTGERRERSGVSGYHGSVRPEWWKNAQGIGMELEIKSHNRDKLATRLSLDIMAERDGSLDEYKGVELIGGPYSCKDYQDGKTPWNETLEIVKKIGGEGHEAGTGYGIHLSISRSLFTTLHAAKFVVFFNQQSPLVKLVAQRSVIYGCGGYGTRSKIKDALTEKLDFDSYDHKQKRCTKKKKTVQTGKYEPVYADEKRLEVRVFRSNLKWDRILKNIEFVQAVFDFTRDCGISIIADADKGTTAFLDWLQRQNDFKVLKSFLYETKNRKSFQIETTEVTNNELLKTFNFKPKTPQTIVADQ